MNGTNYAIPRRNQLDKNTPAELSILTAMGEVEKLQPNEKLTEAVKLLSKAKDLLGDIVDGKAS